MNNQSILRALWGLSVSCNALVWCPVIWKLSVFCGRWRRRRNNNNICSSIPVAAAHLSHLGVGEDRSLKYECQLIDAAVVS